MDTIRKLVLVDDDVFPSDDVIAQVLGEAYPLYQDLLKVLEKHDIGTEWRYYNDGKAWLCKCQHKKKTGAIQSEGCWREILRLIDSMKSCRISF